MEALIQVRQRCHIQRDVPVVSSSPASLDQVPDIYIRQMATYRALLQKIYPDRPISCALIWTDGARLMALPEAALDAAAP